MPKRRTTRIYSRTRGGARRFYVDLRDLGGGREALTVPGEISQPWDRDVQSEPLAWPEDEEQLSDREALASARGDSPALPATSRAGGRDRPAPLPFPQVRRGVDDHRFPEGPRYGGKARGLEGRRDPLEDVPAYVLVLQGFRRSIEASRFPSSRSRGKWDTRP